MKKLFTFVCALVYAASLSAKTIYLIPNSCWLSDNARFAVYAFTQTEESKVETWVDMTAVEGTTGVYQATIDESSYNTIIFCRMNPSKTENNWDAKWTQTGNLLLADAGDKNCYIIEEKENNWSDAKWVIYKNPYFALHSNCTNKNWKTLVFTPSQDNATATLALTLEGDSVYEFGVRIGRPDSYISNGITLKRESNTVDFNTSGNGNNKLTTDIEGEYVFTYTFATKVLSVTYPNDTIFYVNTNNWENVHCYAWTDTDNNATWPGELMKKADYPLQGCDVYYYVSKPYENCQFNNTTNEGKTGDLTWTSRSYYYYYDTWKTFDELKTLPVIQVAGDFFGNWDARGELTTAKDQKSAAITIALTANKTYAFKIIKNASPSWLGNNGTMTRGNSTGWTFKSETNNAQITADTTGNYTFTWTYNGDKLSVTYPAPSDPTAISNDEVESAPAKRIHNGQVVIVREGVTYNMMGQVIE